MSSSLRTHVMDSLASWLEFLEDYTTDSEGKFAPEKGLVGRPPLLKIEHQSPYHFLDGLDRFLSPTVSFRVTPRGHF